MKIVILDAYTAAPDPRSWDLLRAVGDVEVYERTVPEQVVERAAGAEALLLNKVKITREVMDALPSLRYIGVLATGYNVVDIEVARQRGIVVSNVPAYSTMSVAQMVFAHVLDICNSVAHYTEAVKVGRWTGAKDFCFYDTPLVELDGRTMGIVGLGNTGTAVARMAQAFGMKVLAFSSKPKEVLHDMGIEPVSSYEELFSRADVLSLHCPLVPGTYHLANAERISLMKPTAILVNTGRGPLVDEKALAEALNEKRIYAAGVDVLSEEPPHGDNPLLSARNCRITPHIAWATVEARKRLVDTAIANVRAFLMGKPQNVVG